MSQPPPNATNNAVLRITEADAGSTHVDDLLKRQASLRGETGIARDKGRKWYYQNWFVLMLAGTLAAFVGWALLEPLIKDRPYIEGNIQDLKSIPGSDGAGVMTLGGKPYFYLEKVTRVKSSNGTWDPLKPDTLRVGERVGVYVDTPQDQTPKSAEQIERDAEYIVPDAPASNVTDDLSAALQKQQFGGMMFFTLVAGVVGLFIGATDGLLCRLPRRILVAGGIGLIAGLTGGFIATFLADALYGLVSHWATQQHGGGALGLSTTGFLAQMGGRALGWAIAGSAMGLGQGLALRSGKVLFYGLLGGIVGGLLGGLLFDPIAVFVSGEHTPSAYLSRMIGLTVVGASVGLMIGIVELLARDAWLRMVAGPLAGKEFLIFKNTMQVGASPKSDIYLFNDPEVASTHAVLRANGDQYEIEGTSDVYPLTVNDRAVKRTRLRHGDQIGLGRTVFVFQRKRG